MSRRRNAIIRELNLPKQNGGTEESTNPEFMLIDARKLFCGSDTADASRKNYVVLKVIYNKSNKSSNNN